MKIDFDLLSKKLGDKTDVRLLSTEEYKCMVKPVYDYVKKTHPDVMIFLLWGGEILCPLKTRGSSFSILLGVCCPIHSFEDSIGVHNEIQQEDMTKLSREGNLVCDGTYDPLPFPHGKEIFEDMVIVTRNQLFYDYYSYRYDAKPFYPLERRDRMRYLSSRCNNGEKIKGLKVFGIVFTSRVYENLARSIRTALVSRHKNAYLLFLRDLSYERMIAIEGIECIVVVDCPMFDFSDIELHIPIVTPFEVEYALTNNWDGKFDKNSFNVGIMPTGSAELDHILKTEGAHLKQNPETIPFYNEEESGSKIHVGKSGTAHKYSEEDK